MKKILRILLPLAILLAILLLFPFSKNYSSNYKGFCRPVDGSGEMTACSVSFDGKISHYVLRDDKISGSCAITMEDGTYSGKTDATFNRNKDRTSWIAHLDKENYATIGYFVSDEKLTWIYARMEAEDGKLWEIMVPAGSEDGTGEILEKARDYIIWAMPEA